MSDAERENQLPTDIENIPFNNAVENLKTQYDFVQVNEISTFLKNYPSLIDDLNRVHEAKSRYFKDSPMTLYYISETGSLDSATLAAYIEIDIPIEEAKEIFSQFRKEMWQKISRQAKHLVTVGMD